MAIQRTRSTIDYSGTGTRHNLQNVLLATKSNLGRYTKIIDWVGPGDGYNLDIIKITASGGIINHSTSGNISGRRWTNWQASRLSSPTDPLYTHVEHPDQPSNAALATECLKMTNPSRPFVDLGIMIGELRELPLLIQRGGENLARKYGQQTLSREFGWKPLVSDLFKLRSLQLEILKRIEEINRLESEGGLKRTVTLWRGSNIQSNDVITQSGDKLTVHHYLDYATQTEIKGYVCWTPTFPNIPAGRRLAKVLDVLLGLRIDASTLWNLIPWTWLIDWFSNVGDILEASRNTMDATHTSVQLMTHSTTTIQGPSNYAEGTISSFHASLETKQRRTSSGTALDASLPFLDNRQISILGSIGVTRRLPR